MRRRGNCELQSSSELCSKEYGHMCSYRTAPATATPMDQNSKTCGGFVGNRVAPNYARENNDNTVRLQLARTCLVDRYVPPPTSPFLTPPPPHHSFLLHDTSTSPLLHSSPRQLSPASPHHGSPRGFPVCWFRMVSWFSSAGKSTSNPLKFFFLQRGCAWVGWLCHVWHHPHDQMHFPLCVCVSACSAAAHGSPRATCGTSEMFDGFDRGVRCR